MGKITFGTHVITKPFGATKKVVKITDLVTGKILTFAPKNKWTGDWAELGGTYPYPNEFVGTPAEAQAKYENLKDSIPESLFISRSGLTSLDLLPSIKSIGNFAFWRANKLTHFSAPGLDTVGTAFTHSPLTSLSIPKVRSISAGAFTDALLTSLDLPEAIQIFGTAFYHSPLTSLSIPKVSYIEANAFVSIVNTPATHVTMLSKFNTVVEKDKIFGAGHWNQITFTWI